MQRRTASLWTIGAVGMAVAASTIAGARASGTPAGPDSHGKTSLTLAHVLSSSHSVHASLQFMAYRLAELSGGSVEMQVVSGGQLGTEPESIQQLQTGALAAAKVSAGAMEE